MAEGSPNRFLLDVILHHSRKERGLPPMQPLSYREKHRTYHYPGGRQLTVHGVHETAIDDGGFLFLGTVYGDALMIPPGWTAMDVMTYDEWTTWVGLL